MGDAMTDDERSVFGGSVSRSYGSVREKNIKVKENTNPFLPADKLKTILKLYIKAGGNLNTKDGNGKTILWHSFNERRSDIADMLITNGADVNIRYEGGKTLLHYFGSNLTNLKILGAAGIKFNVLDKSMHSEIFYVLNENANFYEKFVEDSNERLNQTAWLNAKANEYPSMSRTLTKFDELPEKSPTMESLDWFEAYQMYVSSHQAIFDYKRANSEGQIECAREHLPEVYRRTYEHIDIEYEDIPWVETEENIHRASW